MASFGIINYIIIGSSDVLKHIISITGGYDNHTDTYIEGKFKIDDGECLLEYEVLKELGVSEESLNKYDLRGDISEVCLNDGALYIQAEEAWGLCDFRKALKDIYPDIEIYFQSDEEDNNVYLTNDKERKFFKDRYIVNLHVGNEYSGGYYATKEDVIKSIEKYIGKVDKSMDLIKYLDLWNEEHEDNGEYINIYEYKIIE